MYQLPFTGADANRHAVDHRALDKFRVLDRDPVRQADMHAQLAGVRDQQTGAFVNSFRHQHACFIGQTTSGACVHTCVRDCLSVAGAVCGPRALGQGRRCSVLYSAILDATVMTNLATKNGLEDKEVEKYSQ